MSFHTIHEIARIVGVSSTTVSRVLNGSKQVSRETRARVEAVISDLNYQPNAHAIELVRSRNQRRNQSNGQTKPDGKVGFAKPLEFHKLELESLRWENSRLRSVVATLLLEIAEQRRRRAEGLRPATRSKALS